MAAVLEDLGDVQLVGEDADAVLLGGADETEETNRVFSYMNLARAFAELELGAELYSLHKNRWWQTSRGPLLDSGCFVAGLEYAAEVEATVVGKPSAPYFTAALEALDADAEMTWMVGDDIEADVAGAQQHGLKTALVRTGSSVPTRSSAARCGRTPSSRRSRTFPTGWRARDPRRRRHDRDRPDPRGAGAIHRLSRPLLHGGRAGLLRRAKEPGPALRRPVCGKEAVGKALGLGVARLFAWRDIEIAGRPKPSVKLSGRVEQWAERVEAGPIDLSMSHSRELASAVCVVAPRDA